MDKAKVVADASDDHGEDRDDPGEVDPNKVSPDSASLAASKVQTTVVLCRGMLPCEVSTRCSTLRGRYQLARLSLGLAISHSRFATLAHSLPSL